jgi:hypothetical protein
LIQLLNLSFDSFNLLHRWFGRIVILESVLHAAIWAASEVYTASWAEVLTEITTDSAMLWGFIVSISYTLDEVAYSHGVGRFGIHCHCYPNDIGYQTCFL